jgi:hypothetical protein
MDHPPIHRPPPAALVTALVRAGVSIGTAMAMERWKAQEVLDLLTGTMPASLTGDEGLGRPA